jgi:N-carbamoyl-L-amino-acid hydrolase
MIDAAAVVAALRATDTRSRGNREAWTPEWEAERAQLDALARAAAPGLVIERDAFANTWYVLPGDSADAVLVGSHSDSVPGGGWLDGILGVHAGLGLLASAARKTGRARTLAVVDWADEEGTRFGRSLLGSTAATGALSPTDFAALRTADGLPAAGVVEQYGFDATALGQPLPRLAEVRAAIELHIEQGPVLERSGRPVAAVAGCLGVRRLRIEFGGQRGHAGATPMDHRLDPVRHAAAFICEVMELAEVSSGLATVGRIAADPGLPTVVPARVELTLDLRHPELSPLEELAAAARAAAGQAQIERLFSVDPVHFDQQLLARAVEVTDGGEPLISGPLHDSVSLAVYGVPTMMLFAPSIGGISHARAEDTAESDLAEAIAAFGSLADQLLTTNP